MILRSFLSATTLALVLGTSAHAGEVREKPKAVLELFTSQGCASCPKADAMLTEMQKSKDLITLAYHVDYWDYIGWPDTFGAEANSDRQRSYAESWGSSRIFTPQLIVNGSKGVVASRKGEVDNALNATGLDLPVNITADGDMLDIEVSPKDDEPDAMVWLVTFIDKSDVTIERGENEGKQISYTQIVTGRQVLGMYEAGAGAKFKLPIAEVLTEPSNGAVILVQREKPDGLPGPIVGAASFVR